MGRIIGIDYGTKRTGIAVTDPFKIIASGLRTVNTNEIFSFLNRYFKKESVEKVVIGLPKQMNGNLSQSAIYVKKFVKEFKRKFPKIEIIEIDERFTSKIAYVTVINSGLRKKKRQNKSLLDKISATIILQNYLYQISKLSPH